jgi:hypothetical protein
MGSLGRIAFAKFRAPAMPLPASLRASTARTHPALEDMRKEIPDSGIMAAAAATIRSSSVAPFKIVSPSSRRDHRNPSRAQRVFHDLALPIPNDVRVSRLVAESRRSHRR